VSLAVEPVGEPDAGDRHVRFDERGWDTERWHRPPSYRAHPRLYRFELLDGAVVDKPLEAVDEILAPGLNDARANARIGGRPVDQGGYAPVAS
jgi:hypothetical protein